MTMKKYEETKPTKILVVDDDAGIRRLVQTLLKNGGYPSDTVEDAFQAQQQLAEKEYDVVISDIMMPGMSGIDLLKIIQKDCPEVPVILMTGNPDLGMATEAIRAGSVVDYLRKPFSSDQILRTVERAVEIKKFRDDNRRLTAENERYQLHLEEMVEEKSAELMEAHDFTLEAMVAMLDAREKATGQHSVRVRNLSLILGRALGLSSSELDDLARGTLLHDIGKIATPDAILLKPGKLTDEEWVIMKTHAQTGYDIVQSSEHLSPAAELILSHHEKFDGSGYPRGLKGKEICLGARIFSVIDAYDAMRSIRVYKGPVPASEAVDEIVRCGGAHFDPDVVQVFLTCQAELEEVAGWDTLDHPPLMKGPDPMQQKPPAVLLGTHCITGLQASRILWRKGVPVIGVSDDVKRAYCRTRSVKRTIATSEIWDNPLPLLKEITAQYGARPVLIPCTDEFVWWLNARRDEIGDLADFLLPPHDILELLSDKAQFYRYATEHNLPLPETRIVATLDELALASREMSFPTVLKPPRKSPQWMELSNNLKVLKVETAEDLLRIGKVLLETSHLILQDWVRGPESNSRELCVCFDNQSRPLASLFLKKIRQWPPAVGVSSLAVEVPPDETVSTSLDMLQNLGYAGAGQLEFKKDEESGKLYIIEMNAGRVALNFPLCEACGIEMTYTCYCAAAGLPLPETRTITRPGAKWICWKTDLASAYSLWRRGDLTVREWLRSIRGHKWAADIQRDDLFPTALDLTRKGSTFLARRIRKMMPKR